MMIDKLQLEILFCPQIKSHTIAWHLRSKYFGSPINSVQPPLLSCWSSQLQPPHRSPNILSDFFFFKPPRFLSFYPFPWNTPFFSLSSAAQILIYSSNPNSHITGQAASLVSHPVRVVPLEWCCISLHVRGADIMESDRRGPEPYLCHDQL